jgi:hypothetical protein
MKKKTCQSAIPSLKVAQLENVQKSMQGHVPDGRRASSENSRGAALCAFPVIH